jgi:hypothetical protein
MNDSRGRSECANVTANKRPIVKFRSGSRRGRMGGLACPAGICPDNLIWRALAFSPLCAPLGHARERRGFFVPADESGIERVRDK